MTNTVQLDDEHARKLEQLASIKGSSREDIVHAALDAIDLPEKPRVNVLPGESDSVTNLSTDKKEAAEFPGARSAYDILMEAGIIGAIKHAPSDLSTNPKYMEGFGSD